MNKKIVKQIFKCIKFLPKSYFYCQESSTLNLSTFNNVILKKQIHFSSTIFAIRTKRRRKVPEAVILQQKSSKEVIEIYDDITLTEICATLKENFNDVAELITNLNENNLKYVESPNSILDKKLVLDISASYNFKPRFVTRPASAMKNLIKDILPQPPPSTTDCQTRPPIVTIMGHVDHGKTTLLDFLRKSRIAAQEFGGITQHIGAFSVTLPKTNKKVTFLDTPGHSAFKAMRERGARVTDIVVLVVAADDGVKDQTIESIKYAKEAGVSIVVAINKCDKPTANPKVTREQLLQHDVVFEDMGGDVQVVEISALEGQNVDKLQEALIAQAEILDLKTTPKGFVEGVVIESSIQQGLGKVCTIVVNRGTLKKNCIVLAGTSWGKVKTMHDEYNKLIDFAGPSTPIRISGWRNELPSPGEIVFEVENEKKAQLVAELRANKKKTVSLQEDWKEIEKKRENERDKYLQIRKERLLHGIRYDSGIRRIEHKKNPYSKTNVASNSLPKLNVILRCDVDGTLEAILNVIQTYESEMVKLDLVDFGVGPPNETNLIMAKEFEATIYCFNISIPSKVHENIIQNKIQVKQFNVIYKLVDELKEELSSMLSPIIEKRLLGQGHVLKQFLISDGLKKRQPVAGVLIDSGNFDKTKLFRFIRKEEIYYEGKIDTMKHEETFVSASGKNTEVGIVLLNKDIRFKPDDKVEVYEEIVIPQKIDWNPPGF